MPCSASSAPEPEELAAAEKAAREAQLARIMTKFTGSLGRAAETPPPLKIKLASPPFPVAT